jgi:IS5 family transposase
MRLKQKPQVELNFTRSDLKLTKEYYAKYEAISRFLDANSPIVSCVHRDLEKPLKHAGTKNQAGRSFRYTSEQVLRILVSQILEGESLRGIVVRIDDSHFLRHFVRVYDGPMMDYTTLCKLKNAIRPQTWYEINRLLAVYSVKQGLISGDRIRMDTTAVETNIHWPTDSSLLWDTYRTLAGLLEKAREIDPHLVGTKRLHRRRAKRLHTKIARTARKRGQPSLRLKPLYKDLTACVEGICAWAHRVAHELRLARKQHQYSLLDDLCAEHLAQEMDRYADCGRRVLHQARRRVLEGESVPNQEKIFSLFEQHTELLKRGKAGKDIEFGHMIEIQQVPEKFITHYTVFEKQPLEYRLLTPALENHKELFNAYPQELSADKGYYESMQTLEELQRKVPIISIGKKGKRNPYETERENHPLFQLAQRFRAGIEGSISFLKRILRLYRCFNKGWDHFVATIGQTIFAHNLLILARL